MEYNEELERQRALEEIAKQGLTPEQLQMAKMQKLQAMGLPIPLPKPAGQQSVRNVKNPAAMSKLEEIKRGANKNFFKKVELISDGVMPDKIDKVLSSMESKPNSPSGHKQGVSAPIDEGLPPIKPLPSEFKNIEDELYGNSNKPGTSVIGNPYQQGPISEEQAIYNAQAIKNKFFATVEQKQAAALAQQQQFVQQPYIPPVALPTIPVAVATTTPNIHSGMYLIDEEDLKKKIISISSQVAKKISEQTIKTVLSEYLKISKNTIVETEKIKKAELVGENTVKIDGKVYKLVPQASKKASE